MILMLVAALPEHADIQASGMHASRLFKRANPLCLGCQAAFGRDVPTAVTDHVIPHKGDMRVFWDRSKWQPACAWHHDAVKARLEVMLAAGQAQPEDMWLTSDLAVDLARSMRGVR
jgi:hypothetical protein